MSFKSTQTQYSRIYLNSDHRKPNELADNFTINLPQVIEKPESIILNQAIIPYLCYSIPSYEGTFTFNLRINSTVTDPNNPASPFYWAGKTWIADAQPNYYVLPCTITINTNRIYWFPEQLVTELNNAIQTQLNPSGSTQFWNFIHGVAPYTSSPNALSFFFDSDMNKTAPAGSNSQKFSFGWIANSTRPAITGNNYIAVNAIGWNNIYNSLQYRLGFTSFTDYPYQAFVTNSPTTTVNQATSPYNINRTTCVYIQCNLSGDSMTDNDYTDILACIPVPALSNFTSFGSILVWQQQNEAAKIKNFLPNYVRTVSIRLLDDQFLPLGLPDNAICNFEICLGFNESDKGI